jgi:hypothetical protein
MTGPMTGANSARPVGRTVCAGSSYEMGHLQGQALAGRIAGCRDALRDLEPFRLLQPRWLPYSLFLRSAAKRAQGTLADVVKREAPTAHARLAGIAAGSGARAEDLWLLQTLEALLGSVGDAADQAPIGACSAVWLDESRSPVGEPFVAHNYDYAKIVQPYLIVRESRPVGGFRSLELTVAPLSGALDGLNEAGLAITYNYGLSTEPARPNPTISMRIAETLAKAESVETAVESLEMCTRWGGGLLMVADANGEAASLELTSSRQGVNRPGGDGMLLHTNKYHLKETIESEVSEDAVFNDHAPRSLRGEHVLDSPKTREARLRELITLAGRLDLDVLQVIMADHGGDETGNLNTICMHSEYLGTSACIQCLPRSRTMRVSVGPACRPAFSDYSL